jgi:hypothetical protein
MAFRIEDCVVGGEIDNRVKGTVRGKIWLEGRKEPVLLELRGNAWPDLAGCLLTFKNPAKRYTHYKLDTVNAQQRGRLGDLTASRKVRVYDVPEHEAEEMIERGEKPPEHMANCLYMEWFSEANGRMLIESAEYEVTVSAPEWQLTSEEKKAVSKQADEAMTEFLHRLDEKIERHKKGQKDPEEPWDEHDYEKFLKESDARTDKYMELLEKYGDSDEAEARIAKEMGWDRELAPEEAEEEARRIEEMNAACEAAMDEPEPEPDPTREGIDWIRTKSGDLRHPLQNRCFESAIKYWHQVDELGLDKTGDKDLDNFIFEFQTTGAKLAGALDPLARGQAFPEASFTVAYLKRALDHLHKSQAGLEGVAPKKLLPESTVTEARKELFEIREGILRLMDELRGRTGPEEEE